MNNTSRVEQMVQQISMLVGCPCESPSSMSDWIFTSPHAFSSKKEAHAVMEKLKVRGFQGLINQHASGYCSIQVLVNG